MSFLSLLVRDVVIVGEPNPAEQLHTTQPSDVQAAVLMEAALGESINLFRLVLNIWFGCVGHKVSAFITRV